MPVTLHFNPPQWDMRTWKQHPMFYVRQPEFGINRSDVCVIPKSASTNAVTAYAANISVVGGLWIQRPGSLLQNMTHFRYRVKFQWGPGFSSRLITFHISLHRRQSLLARVCETFLAWLFIQDRLCNLFPMHTCTPSPLTHTHTLIDPNKSHFYSRISSKPSLTHTRTNTRSLVQAPIGRRNREKKNNSLVFEEKYWPIKSNPINSMRSHTSSWSEIFISPPYFLFPLVMFVFLGFISRPAPAEINLDLVSKIWLFELEFFHPQDGMSFLGGGLIIEKKSSFKIF